jgi:hypothetical protein
MGGKEKIPDYNQHNNCLICFPFLNQEMEKISSSRIAIENLLLATVFFSVGIGNAV